MGHVATSHDSTADDSVVNARTTRRTETARILEEASRAESPERRKALHDEVIRLNMQVAGEIARRYHGRGIPNDDITQVANLGLVKAAQGFDPTQGSDFLSFAVPTIRGEIRRYFRDFGWTIRPPRSVQELQTKITAAEGELFQSLGRSPRPSEIARHLDVDLELVLDSLAANGCFAPVSLDTPVADGESGPGDRLGGVDPAFASAEARVALKSVMRGLTRRERRILQMRFSRLLTRLLDRLRKRLEEQVPAA